MRRKVQRAAEELGYHVNHLARSLIQEDSRIVCVIGAEINTPYQARMLEALSSRHATHRPSRDGDQHAPATGGAPKPPCARR